MNKNKPVVLVVDDEKDLADSIAQVINDTDRYEAVPVYSAIEASEVIEKGKKGGGQISGPIELIILDIKMPEMDGLQFLQKVRLEHPANKIGVIILTAWEDVDKWKKARMGNVAGYIKKPFKSDDLIKQLDRFFNGKSKWMIEQTKWELLDKESIVSGESQEDQQI